jgi:hypothetical protein
MTCRATGISILLQDLGWIHQRNRQGHATGTIVLLGFPVASSLSFPWERACSPNPEARVVAKGHAFPGELVFLLYRVSSFLLVL